ncbi:MAG: YraN family protein [Oscillospiraceae bacterium]|nr:YraN family protein [Oscillospiraceae bacterium]
MSGGNWKVLGRWGEALVAQDMRRRGFQIVASGYRTRYGELDLIAQNKEYLVFVEVKLRSSEAFAPGRMAVTGKKQQALRTTAMCYLAEHPTALQPRFDVAEVLAPQGMKTQKPHITYIEDAF